MTRRVLVVLAASVAVGCAQPRQPEGGPPIVAPPRVVDVSPAPYSLLTDRSRPVVIRFDERLSERLDGVRDLNDAVLVSPQTGDVRVRRGRRDLTISIEGGWRPDLVYRVVVLPVLRDRFNNVRDEPVDLIFSTGAPMPETAVAGIAEDRITGNPAAGARVHARRADDPYLYVAVTDTAGFFALRELPAGDYAIQVWVDQNRNRTADFPEPQDSTPVSLATGDTAVVELQLLPGDTTPARLVRASVIDSTKVELAFDDYFEPGPITGTGRLYLAADSSFVSYGDLVHRTRLDSLTALDRAADEAAAEAIAPADTVPPQPDTARPPAPARTRPGQDRPPPTASQPRPLPARELILALPAPLIPETAYFVVVEDVTNIHGLPGGGGTTPFQSPPRRPDPPADTVPPDTVPPDTVPPDTVPPDTVPPDAVPPDRVPPDTVPPDTVPPDTVPPARGIQGGARRP